MLLIDIYLIIENPTFLEREMYPKPLTTKRTNNFTPFYNVKNNFVYQQ